MVDVDGKKSPSARSMALVTGDTAGSRAAAYSATAAEDRASLAKADPCRVRNDRYGRCNQLTVSAGVAETVT